MNQVASTFCPKNAFLYTFFKYMSFLLNDINANDI